MGSLKKTVFVYYMFTEHNRCVANIDVFKLENVMGKIMRQQK